MSNLSLSLYLEKNLLLLYLDKICTKSLERHPQLHTLYEEYCNTCHPQGNDSYEYRDSKFKELFYQSLSEECFDPENLYFTAVGKKEKLMEYLFQIHYLAGKLEETLKENRCTYPLLSKIELIGAELLHFEADLFHSECRLVFKHAVFCGKEEEKLELCFQGDNVYTDGFFDYFQETPQTVLFTYLYKFDETNYNYCIILDGGADGLAFQILFSEVYIK